MKRVAGEKTTRTPYVPVEESDRPDRETTVDDMAELWMLASELAALLENRKGPAHKRALELRAFIAAHCDKGDMEGLTFGASFLGQGPMILAGVRRRRRAGEPARLPEGTNRPSAAVRRLKSAAELPESQRGDALRCNVIPFRRKETVQ